LKMVLQMVLQMVLRVVLQMRMRMQMYMTCAMQLKYVIYNLPLRLYEYTRERTRQGKETKQRRSRRQGAGRVQRRRLRPLLLASTARSRRGKTTAQETPRCWFGHGGGG
jgi:hypothetical protein